MKILERFINKQRNTELPVISKVVTIKEPTVEEIHESFYTEVDRLLEEANISKSLDTNKQDLIDKANRLKALGFINTKEVKEAQNEINRLEILKIENKAKKELIDAINYFSFKYPQYKFITEDSVKKICSRYGLIYGEIDRYIGDVPEKNLKHIEQFKIDVKDKLYLDREWYWDGYNGTNRVIRSSIMNYNTYYEYHRLKPSEEYYEKMRYYHPSSIPSRRASIPSRREYICSPLEIAAPIKKFNMRDHEIKDFKLQRIEDRDPVVLQPVCYNNKKYYLIVTAWGDEASDELVINQKMN